MSGATSRLLAHQRPSNDGVPFRQHARQGGGSTATSRGAALSYPPTFDGPRSAFPTGYPYRDYPSHQCQSSSAPIDSDIYTMEDGHLRRRPALLPVGPTLAEFNRICTRAPTNSRYEHIPYMFELVTEPESYIKRPRLSNEPKICVSPHTTHTQQPLIDITKKDQYLPQTEAVSPGAAARAARRDELMSKIKWLEQNISQLETQASLLSKRQIELEAAANRPDVEKKREREKKNTVEASATIHMSIAKQIYSDNRKKAAINLKNQLEKIGNKFGLPLYNQTFDTHTFHLVRQNYAKFKCRLKIFFKKRHKEQQRREEYMTKTYAKLMHTWTKKIEKKENNRKSKDSKLRDFFEKQFPELKKIREERERFSRVGLRIRSDAELDEIMDSLHTQEKEDKKMRGLAVVPPMRLPSHQRSLRYINNNGLLEDLASEFKFRQLNLNWTEKEKDVFREKFLQHPKHFSHIATSLERKTVADCVQFYYLTKKTERYKQLLRKNVKRRRALVKPPPPPPPAQVSRPQEESAKVVTTTSTLEESSSTSLTTTTTATTTVVVAAAPPASAQPEASGGGDTKGASPKEENPVMAEGNTSYEGVCYVCKNTTNQARTLSRSNCEFLGIPYMASKLRICPTCCFKSVHKRCEVPTCKSSKKKIKRLRSLPSKWSELPPEVKEPIMKELQINPSVTRCCSACFNRIARKMGVSSSASGLEISTIGSAEWQEAYQKRERRAAAAGGSKLSEDEESGETTSSCEEDNCVDRSSSDTTSAPSPIEAIEGTSTEKDKEEVIPERPKEELNYDSSATVSADEGQVSSEDKFVRPAVPVPDGKEEPTCVRDLIFQAIEMSLQGSGPQHALKGSVPVSTSTTKKPTTPPAAHRPTETIPITITADQAEDYQVQDLSKKSTKPLLTHHPQFSRPPESCIRTYPPPPNAPQPPPAHFNNRSHDLSSHSLYGENVVRQERERERERESTFFVYPSARTSSSDKIYERAPPHLIAQEAAPSLSLHTSKVPPVPPLTKLAQHYKGSITQGTPSAIRYEAGSITLGTPLQHDLKHTPQVEKRGHYDKPEPLLSNVCLKYFPRGGTHASAMPPPSSLHAFAGKMPFSNESQLSSKQIMIDFNTSKQMQMRRGSATASDKEAMLRASPRTRERDQPLPPTHYGMYLAPDSRLTVSPETTRQNVIQRWGNKQPSVIQSAPRPLPPVCHDAFSALVNVAASKPNLNITSMPRPVLVEGLEKSLLMHQRPHHTYAAGGDAPEHYARVVETAPKSFKTNNKERESSEIHYYDQNTEFFEKQKFSSECPSPHPSLRISGMREPFSREQFERQMRKDMGAERERRDVSFKAKGEEEKHFHTQQVELDNEASRIFSQSFQKDIPKSSSNPRGLTAANLIDAIITRTINQNTDTYKSAPDIFNRYPRPEQRITSTSLNKRKKSGVTIDDEPEREREKERIPYNTPEQRPGSTGRNVCPSEGCPDKAFTSLGEQIASIISKDYSTTNETGPQAPFFSHSSPIEKDNTPITQQHTHSQTQHILAASLDSHAHSQGLPSSDNQNVDHTAQNCPGKGCVFHHSWKLRNALQNTHKENDSSFRDRNIIQIPPQATPPKVSSKSPIATSYIVEPISPPTSTPEPQSSGDQPTWSNSGLPSLLPAAPRLYEAPTGLQLSPLDYVKNRIVEVMRTQDTHTPKTVEEKVASTHLSEELSRYLEPRDSHTPQHFSPYMNVPKSDSSELTPPHTHITSLANWSNEGNSHTRATQHFRPLSPDEQQPRKKFKAAEYTAAENSSDSKIPESTSDQNYAEGSGPRSESSHGSEASLEAEGSNVKQNEGKNDEPEQNTSRIEPVSPPTHAPTQTHTTEAGPTTPYPNPGSYPYPYSALTVRCLPLPPSTSLHPPTTTPATIASSPPTEPQPAPLLSSQYEPLSDED